MKCNHCGSEWTTSSENQKDTCPFCGKQLENVNSSQPAARGRFQLSYDQKTLVQFLGDEKNVVIPTGITRIGAGAFHGYGVETVYIPDGVTEIGDNCFNGCKQLREVRIPSSVTYISDSAFKDTSKKKIIAEKGSYAWNKYAKPVAEDKPVAPTTQAESKPISKTVSVSPSKPVESAEKSRIPTGSNDSKTPSTVQSAGNAPSAKELCEQQVDEFLALQHKKAQWAKLLGCNPGEKPWIIKSSLFVSADKRTDKLIARIKSIHDQELLLQIVEETNDGRVRLAVVKNIADQSTLEQLAYNKKHDIRLAVIEQIKNTKVLEHMALSDVSPSVRMAALKHITSQPILQVIAENDEDDEICKAALIRIRNQEDVEQIALWAPNWHKRKIALDFVKSPVVLHKIARSDQNDDVRRAADARLKASPELTVAALFETIKGDLRINGINALPTKIMLYYDGIQFFSENSLLKTVRFDSYGFNALPQYDSWWAVDGSAAPKHVNQLELLAEHINQSMNKAYYIKKVKSETVNWPGSDLEMHHYIQKYIEMNVKR